MCFYPKEKLMLLVANIELVRFHVYFIRTITNVMNFLENISISVPQTPFLWLFGGVGVLKNVGGGIHSSTCINNKKKKPY